LGSLEVRIVYWSLHSLGLIKTIVPEITTHFSDDMIVLEKWIPSKPISAIYFDGEKKSTL